jgi:predicted MFS family arabinose efflux permease
MIALAKQIYLLLLPQVRLNRSLRILISASTIMNFVIGMFSPFYAIYVVRIGGDIASAGSSWALFQVVCGVLMLLFTRWGLRVKEQELMIALGYILRGGVFISYAFMSSMTQLFLTQILWGIAAAIGVPAFDAVFSSHTSKDSSIAEWGGLEGVTSIAVGIAALIGGYAIKLLGFTSIFYAMAALSFGLGLYIWRLPREVL